MMVCMPDWLFLIFIFSLLLQSCTNLYGTIQSGTISAKLSGFSSRFDELFFAIQQVVHTRNSAGNRVIDDRRRRGLSAIPEGSEETAEA
nr:V3 [Becurtovirus sp.]QTT61627.1 V3 [Becurtovirus sp.]QTT61631.1 V3 [Becurtovirus sp.]QTT61663.1 V3 [Becurtovirus sp.]